MKLRHRVILWLGGYVYERVSVRREPNEREHIIRVLRLVDGLLSQKEYAMAQSQVRVLLTTLGPRPRDGRDGRPYMPGGPRADD